MPLEVADLLRPNADDDARTVGSKRQDIVEHLIRKLLAV